MIIYLFIYYNFQLFQNDMDMTTYLAELAGDVIAGNKNIVGMRMENEINDILLEYTVTTLPIQTSQEGEFVYAQHLVVSIIFTYPQSIHTTQGWRQEEILSLLAVWYNNANLMTFCPFYLKYLYFLELRQ